MSETETGSTAKRRDERTVALALHEWGKVLPLPASTTGPEVDIMEDLAAMKSQMRSMATEISRIRETISLAPVRIRIVKEARDATIPEAKAMIEDYYKTRDVAYPSDIADALFISLETVVAALGELKKEGRVRSV